MYRNLRHSNKMDTVLFIDAVKAYVFLYDVSHPDYKNAVKKNQTWNAIAESCHLSSGAVAKNKWRNLRDSYMKHLRCRTGHNSIKYQNWPHADDMHFLRKYHPIRKRIHATSPIQTSDHYVEDSAFSAAKDDSIPDQQQHHHHHPHQEFVEIKREDVMDENIRNAFINTSDGGNGILSVSASSPNNNNSGGGGGKRDLYQSIVDNVCSSTANRNAMDECDLFFLSLAQTVKRLPKHQRASLKLQCSQLILQAEIDYEMAKS